ncbi:MAG: hypothetical protein M1838_002336 [Thelocarpon superellum]|nr:MAG: hypothetical protein M1838_002336 [Thelocarpon superellum]
MMMKINGEKVRVSWLEAIFLGPPPKKKATPKAPAAQAAPAAAPKPAPPPVAKPAPAPPAAEKAAPVATPAKVQAQPPPPRVNKWTDEADGLLLHLKDNEHLTWKEIHKFLDFSHKELKQRYRDLQVIDKDEERATVAAAGSSTAATKGSTPVPVSWAHAAGPDNSAGQGKRRKARVAFDPGDGIPIEAPEPPLEEVTEWRDHEIELMQRLVAHYDKHKWTQIATWFWDKTGIRVNAETIQQMMET